MYFEPRSLRRWRAFADVMLFFQDEVYIDEDDRFTSSDIVELEASSKIGIALVLRSASNPQNSSDNLGEFS
jgi:hypothetical protein